MSNYTYEDGEEDLDTWKCDVCYGEGLVWKNEVVFSEPGLGTFYQEFQHECLECDGVGWLGPDAHKMIIS